MVAKSKIADAERKKAALKRATTIVFEAHAKADAVRTKALQVHLCLPLNGWSFLVSVCHVSSLFFTHACRVLM